MNPGGVARAWSLYQDILLHHHDESWASLEQPLVRVSERDARKNRIRSQKPEDREQGAEDRSGVGSKSRSTSRKTMKIRKRIMIRTGGYAPSAGCRS
jgi:hypothetical protein